MDPDETIETVTDATDKPEETVTEPVTDPPIPAPAPGSDIPEWGQTLIARVEELATAVAPVIPVADEDAPDPDDSPVRKPWTHRNFFGK